MFRRIKEMYSRKPFKPGDKVRCPNCNAVIRLVKIAEAVPNKNSMIYKDCHTLEKE